MSEEDTPEIFTNEEQEAAGETNEDLFVFSSEEAPEFNDTPDEAMAATENAQNGVIDLTEDANVTDGVYTINIAEDYKFTCKKSPETSNRIVVDGTNTSEQDNINIYLDNVNIKTSAGSALQINNNVKATVTIYLTGINNLTTTNQSSAGLQKDNEAQLIITNASDTTTGILKASSDGSGYGAGIGSGNYGSCNNITIKSGSVTASSTSGAGIGGGLYGSCNNITISGGSVNAQVGCTPHQNLDSSGSYDPKSPEVYLCVIPNTKTKSVAIDNKVWEPSNHKAVESTNTNLYAWLTGEDHLITVEKETKSYIFNSNSGTFSEGKRDVTSDIFEFNGSEFTYDGNTHSPNITTKNNIKGVGNFTVKYFKEDNLQAEINEPKDVGTYIVKITAVEEGDFYNAYSGYLTNDNWKFAINLTPTITTYKDEYDGNPHPVISIEESTIPPNSIIEYSVDNGQTWYILNSNDNIPTVSTVREAENTKIFIRISNFNSNSNDDTWTSQEYQAIIKRATSTPNFPSIDTISVPWSCKKVKDIDPNSLPQNWNWQANDANNDLQVGNNSATAIYNGSDKGNYEKETFTYTIIRKECEHKNTVGCYYSSPSCTSNGYSGDTYCNDCERTIYYGSTISAYGHDYDNGVITTEPTAETDGIITYTCKRCKHQDTKNLGKLGDGEPYIEGSFQKKGWDAVNGLIKTSKEKDTISITLNGVSNLFCEIVSFSTANVSEEVFTISQFACTCALNSSLTDFRSWICASM